MLFPVAGNCFQRNQLAMLGTKKAAIKQDASAGKMVNLAVKIAGGKLSR